MIAFWLWVICLVLLSIDADIGKAKNELKRIADALEREGE